MITRHTIGVEHIRIESAKSFAEVRAALERNVPQLDPTLVKVLAAGDVERAIATLPKFMKFAVEGTDQTHIFRALAISQGRQ